MWGIWEKKEKEMSPEPESATRTKTNAGFEEVASEFSEPARKAESPDPSGNPPEQEKLGISLEWGQGALEGCFLPLAKLDHPAWALTEEEARKGAPKMQAFLQAVADRLAPAILARVVNKYPEFTDLLGMLAILSFEKYKQVRKIKTAESQLRTEKTVASVDGKATVTGETVHCDECGKDFPDRETALGHLPCPGGASKAN